MKIIRIIDTGKDTNSASNDSAKWIPGSFIEPIVEIVVTMLDHIMSGPIIEP